VVRAEPEAWSLTNSLMIERPAHNTSADDVEFDVEDEIVLRAALVEVIPSLNTT